MPVPKLAFDAKVRMDADCLNDAISDIGGVSEQARFEANPDRFVLNGLSETGNVVIEFEKSNEAVLEFNVNAEIKALYGVSFLQDIIRAGTSTSKVVTVEFSTDKPVKLDFELPLKGKLTYYLAPRLE
jgi:proliferating cell nuclear antigen